MKKNKILFIPSHLYLFWTTGYYYLCNLYQNYELILLVNEPFIHQKNFKKILKNLSIKKVEILRNSDKYSNHFEYRTSIYKILKKHKPDLIFQYNSTYLFNKYFYYISKKTLPKTKIIHYQNGLFRATSNDEEYLKIERNKIFNNFSKKFLIPSFIINIIYILFKKIKFILHNIVLPTIILRDFNHKFWKSNLFDKILVFNSLIRNKLIQELKSSEIILIKNPIQNISLNYTKAIYDYTEKKQVLLLPSLIGFLSLDDEKKSIEKWILAINHINNELENFEIIIKFHPRVSENVNFNLIKNYFYEKCNNINIINEKEIVQPLILSSKIIVGDFSTALWWSMCLNKFTISINFDQSYGSDESSIYGGIKYFKSLNSFLNFNLSKVNIKKYNNKNEPKKSLMDALASL